MADFANSGGHWYSQDGSAAYTVKAKAGHDRPTTIKDARALSLVPSVTGILKLADKPALTNWLIDQAILAALTLPRTEGESEQAWLTRVKRDGRAEGKAAAEKGTAIHGAIERHYQGIPPDPELWDYAKAAVDCVADHAGGGPWNAERSFASPLGYGGKLDLHSADWVIDFKGKDFGPEDDLRAWDEHAMQLAAYRMGLNLPEARAAIVYVSRSTPGLASFVEIGREALSRGWEMFQALLRYWKAVNKYDPAITHEEAHTLAGIEHAIDGEMAAIVLDNAIGKPWHARAEAAFTKLWVEEET